MSGSVLVILLWIVWIILSGELSVTVILSGFAFSIISYIITETIFKRYVNREKLGLIKGISFFAMVILDVYKAGIAIIPTIIKGDATPEIVTIETALDDDLKITLLANAITLTPGTITVEKKGKVLRVLWFNPGIHDKNRIRNMIIGKLEKRLRR